MEFPRDNEWSNSGVSIDFHRKKKNIPDVVWIGGYYDSCVGIPSDTVTLREFFDLLNITEKDVEKAFGKKFIKDNK